MQVGTSSPLPEPPSSSGISGAPAARRSAPEAGFPGLGKINSHARRSRRVRPLRDLVRFVSHGSQSRMTHNDLVEQEHRYVMGTFKRLPVTFVEGRGVTVRDSEGREYLDLVAGIAVNVLGHAHPAGVSAVAAPAAPPLPTPHPSHPQPHA